MMKILFFEQRTLSSCENKIKIMKEIEHYTKEQYWYHYLIIIH